MTSTQRFTVELAKKLGEKGWVMADGGYEGAVTVENTTELHEAVCACAHYLIGSDRADRIRTLEAELDFLRGMK